MIAFAAATAMRPTTRPLPRRCPCRGLTSQLDSGGDTPAPRDGVKFRATDDDAAPRRSFSSSAGAGAGAGAARGTQTPNARALARVRASMERLGVSERPRAPPPPRKPVDISRVKPLNALAGSAGAAVIFYGMWTVLQGTVAFYVAHPYETDMYVLQRINAVVRTVLVGMFALASGISGVTSLGLFLLFGRTAVAAATGEFRDKQEGAGGK